MPAHLSQRFEGPAENEVTRHISATQRRTSLITAICRYDHPQSIPIRDSANKQARSVSEIARFSPTCAERELDNARLPRRGRGSPFRLLMTALATLAMATPKRKTWEQQANPSRQKRTRLRMEDLPRGGTRGGSGAPPGRGAKKTPIEVHRVPLCPRI